MTNRADVKPKKPKSETVAQVNQATKKAEEAVSKTNKSKRTSDSSGGDLPPNNPPADGGDMSSTRETDKVKIDKSAAEKAGKNTGADTGSVRETGGGTTLTPIDDEEDDSDADNSEEHKD